MRELAVVGFDSAWTDRPSTPGAVCIIRAEEDGSFFFLPPKLASFDQALATIQAEVEQAKVCLVAIDQPTIVPNVSGCRPVERVAGSLVSFVGGGVQPANQSKIGMFDNNAPIWRFKKLLNATEAPETARSAKVGLFILEVFPALALPSMDGKYHVRHGGPRYNPGRKKTF